MIKAILWDNDGVLVNTEYLFYEANREMFRPHGIELSERHFYDWYLADNCGAWHLLAERGMGKEEMDAMRAVRDQRHSVRLASESPLAIPGIAQVLERFSERVPMGIVTGSRRDHFDIIHGPLDLLRHFRFAVTAEDYEHSKPSPEPYLLGLDKLGLPASECLAIEDSPRGLQAALAAGLTCIAIRAPLTRDCPFTGAWRVVDTMAQLQDEIAALIEA
jgi:HAD superfamily hydrolase (TIGR01509 family)